MSETPANPSTQFRYLLLAYPFYSLRARHSQKLEPLLIMTVPGTLSMPIALLLYGWSLYYNLGIMLPTIAVGILGASFLTTFVSLAGPCTVVCIC
jgi:hypothetical protein